MSPEEKAIDVDAANVRLAAMKLKESQAGPGDPAAMNSAKPAKKPRSDKGKPRKPAPEQPGSSVWLSRLRDLIDTRESRRAVWDSAVDHATACEAEYVQASKELDAHIAAFPSN